MFIGIDNLEPYETDEYTLVRFLLIISLSTTCYAGHYKFHPEEYRAAVTELLKKASVLYMSRRQLNGYDVGTSEHSDTPPSTSNLPRTAASSVGRLRRAPIDPTDQFFFYRAPWSTMKAVKDCNRSCLTSPKNVDGWVLKPYASMNGKHGTSIPLRIGMIASIR